MYKKCLSASRVLTEFGIRIAVDFNVKRTENTEIRQI